LADLAAAKADPHQAPVGRRAVRADPREAALPEVDLRGLVVAADPRLAAAVWARAEPVARAAKQGLALEREGAGIGGPGGGPGGAKPKPPLKTIRLIIKTTDGMNSEAYVPADTNVTNHGWRQIGIPLQAITGFDKTNKVIKEIGFGTDQATTIWIGDIRTIVDTTPITGDADEHELNLAQGDEVTLSANGFAGASMLKYEWYFDGEPTGIPDAVGQAIKHKFRKPDTYTITLVISDYFGLKTPYKTTITAKVN
jgi:hypothetical protein